MVQYLIREVAPGVHKTFNTSIEDLEELYRRPDYFTVPPDCPEIRWAISVGLPLPWGDCIVVYSQIV